MLGKSAIVDLSHALAAPANVGDRGRPDASADVDRPGMGNAGAVRSFDTRLDARGLVGKEQRSVAQIPSRDLLVSAVVVNAVPQVTESPEYHLTVNDLKIWERQHGRIPKKSAVLLHTGWSRRWLDPAQYANEDGQGLARVPGFSPAAVAFLVTERQVSGVGLDAFVPAVQAGATGEAMSPRLPPGVWRLENLVNLDRLPARGAKLVVAPLRIDAATAPVRVMAILP
jgi:kynurenine formamidase